MGALPRAARPRPHVAGGQPARVGRAAPPGPQVVAGDRAHQPRRRGLGHRRAPRRERPPRAGVAPRAPAAVPRRAGERAAAPRCPGDARSGLRGPADARCCGASRGSAARCSSSTTRRRPVIRRSCARGADAWDELEEFRREAGGSIDPVTPPELAGPVQRGLVWVLANESGQGAGAMFRVEGVARRRVQITDACVAPALRGQGIGAALLRSAANIARTEYARGAVIARGRRRRRRAHGPAGRLHARRRSSTTCASPDRP